MVSNKSDNGSKKCNKWPEKCDGLTENSDSLSCLSP